MVSLRVGKDYRPLAIVAARTSLFLVNFGFWVGSLWGDQLASRTAWTFPRKEPVPDWVFVIGWAVALIATGIWAAKRNKRWVVNLVAVFGATHFYTQYFERLGASPTTVLIAGLVALGIAFLMVHYNRGLKPAEAQ
jgi:hypothetical protein